MQCEALIQKRKAVLFNLDNTLYDHYHSLRCAMSVLQDKYATLKSHGLEELIDKYNAALQGSSDRFLKKEILFGNTNVMEVRSFFAELGLAEPGLDEVNDFRAAFKPAYSSNQRATPGSIETLVRLRENGHLLAIISNGDIDVQASKAKAIGIHQLVDRIFTSEEAGCCKPDRRIFQLAIEAFDVSPDMIYIVGDSTKTNVKSAFDAGLSAVLYSPVAQESQRLLYGEQVPVIHHMSQLLEQLGMANPHFEPYLYSGPGQLIIEGLGIDLVTEPRHCLQITKETVSFLAEKMGQVLECISGKHYRTAMYYAEQMIMAIARVAMPIDETKLLISYPGQGKEPSSVTQTGCHFTIRDRSICAEYVRLALAVDSEIEPTLCESTVLLQSHCNNLMRDYPRAAVRDLRSIMLILAERAGIKDDTVVEGENIDH